MWKQYRSYFYVYVSLIRNKDVRLFTNLMQGTTEQRVTIDKQHFTGSWRILRALSPPSSLRRGKRRCTSPARPRHLLRAPPSRPRRRAQLPCLRVPLQRLQEVRPRGPAHAPRFPRVSCQRDRRIPPGRARGIPLGRARGIPGLGWRGGSNSLTESNPCNPFITGDFFYWQWWNIFIQIIWWLILCILRFYKHVYNKHKIINAVYLFVSNSVNEANSQ